MKTLNPSRLISRREAGHALALELLHRSLPAPVVVVALPRGGVPVAVEVALMLRAPLDLLLVHKIGAPGRAELALAALVDGVVPEIVFDDAGMARYQLDREFITCQALRLLPELDRRRREYLRGRKPVPVDGATVVLVDDGIATGTTMRAAIQALRRRAPARVVLAVPVASPDALALLRDTVDELVCLQQPEGFEAVSRHYIDFEPVDDAEVRAGLASVDAALRLSHAVAG